MSGPLDMAAEVFDKTRSFPPYVMNKILKTLRKELEGCGRILDVGAGTGRFSKPLQDAGFEVVGVDVSKKFLAYAHGKGTEDLVLGDACNLPFQASTFDASISIGTLHLIAKWKSALQEIVRVTKNSLFTVYHSTRDYVRTPSDVYKELVEKNGYSCRHPGIGEWKLKEIIRSTKSKFIISYGVSVDERISLLREKVFSYQRNVPQNVHEKAMDELEKIFAGKKEYTVNVYVYKWDINEIKNYLESL